MTFQTIFVCIASALTLPATAATVDINGPTGSESFGASVVALKNGNFVVTDPGWSPDNQSYLGAVYLYDGQGTLISTLIGAPPYTSIGNLGIVTLPNGNFVVCSKPTDFGANGPQGSVTLVNGSTGLNGTVSGANSLLNFAPATSGCAESIVVLSDSNFLVLSGFWIDPNGDSLGAVAYCSGTTGCNGPISATNSLVGSSDGDEVGVTAIALPGGRYAVGNPWWSSSDNNSVGAITYCNHAGGCYGSITASNSLIGTQADDQIGTSLTALNNGNFVAISPPWHNTSGLNVGAITLLDGAAGLPTAITAENSVIGSNSLDFSSATVTPLVGGNFVVSTPYWDDGASPDVGAVFLCSESSGCPNHIGGDVALVGSTAHDGVGYRTVALSTGNYVIGSALWNGNLGAVTFCNGAAGCVGSIDQTNSLIGIQSGDCVGCDALTPLSSGNYVVGSDWGGLGASTWCDGSTGCVGAISQGNSLVGDGDALRVAAAIWPLTNGNYVVFNSSSPNFGLITETARVETGPQTGVYSDSNSFTGIATTTSDPIAEYPVENGNFIARSDYWSGANYASGAISLVRGYGPHHDSISTSNSVFGTADSGGPRMSFAYNPVVDTLVVGRPADNIVSLLKVDQLFFGSFDQ